MSVVTMTAPTPTAAAADNSTLVDVSLSETAVNTVAAISPDKDAVVTSSSPSNYLSYLTLLKQVWTDRPDVTITYDQLAYTLNERTDVRAIPTMANSVLDTANALIQPYTYMLTAPPTRDFHALRPASGVIRPGTMTLILAPPGHSKSLFLKSLAGRFRHDKHQTGDIRWNGMSVADSDAAGLQLHRITAYVDQVDMHIPQLTVRETFHYAIRHATAALSGLPQQSGNDSALRQLTELELSKVELMIDLLGLRECADTVVGDDLLRGVSGGQKRRVTIGEMLLLNTRVLLLDEITTGLDSSTALEIIKLLFQWTRLMNGSVVTALLQPSPEIYALFDDLILMREGQIVYHGPAQAVLPYMESLGFSTPNDQDTADYLTDLMTYPRAVYHRNNFRKIRQQRKQQAMQQSAPAVSEHPSPADVIAASTQPEVALTIINSDETMPTTAATPASPAARTETTNDDAAIDQALLATERRVVPLTRNALYESYKRSSYYAEMQVRAQEAAAEYPPNTYQQTIMPSWSKFTRSSYQQAYTYSILQHTFINLMRQTILTIRNQADLIPRVGQSIFMGLVFGSLYVNLSNDDYFVRNGVITFCIIFIGFVNVVEIPHAAQAKTVVWKQYEAGFYPTVSYISSQTITQAVIALIGVIFFVLPIYWLVGFDANAGRFFFFFLIVYCVNLFFAGIFRNVTYAVGSAAIANQLSGPIIFSTLLFSGYLIQYDNIPRWMLWLFWFSPFSWALRSLAQNEYLDERYSGPYTPGSSQTEGEAYLSLSGLDQAWAYKWAAVGYLLGMFFLFTILSVYLLANVRQLLFLGTRRNEQDEEAEDAREEASLQLIKSPSLRIAQYKATNSNNNIRSSYMRSGNSQGASGATGASSALPFIPVDLVWSHIHYTISVKRDGKNVDRALLNGVSGYARAGSLTALMGSSGAGKTTLMDVLAGRKTGGQIKGSILVNGFPKESRTFNRVVGYVEQNDIHDDKSTIEEALHFSAKLRLPRTVSDEQRRAFVAEVLETLELKVIADRLISSLSPGQLKRLTIGVELVANPPILFLDEPTSGLDSRAALIVMRVVKRIAESGRSVLCTIHQPSSELFYFFDRVQVLQSGGVSAYFGDVGESGASMIEYFQNAPIPDGAYRPEFPEKMNPSSWMLDVIGAGTAGIKTQDKQVDINYADIYRSSKLYETNESTVASLSKPQPNSTKLTFDSTYAQSFPVQLSSVMYRLWMNYWRDTAYNWTRFSSLLGIALIAGLLNLYLSANSQANTIQQLGAIYVGLGFIGTTNVSSALPVLLKLRAVFYRERSSYTYYTIPYAISISLVEIPYLLFGTLIFIIPYYFLIGLENDAGRFFATVLMFFLVALTFTFWGQFLAAALPDLVAANIFQGLSVTFFFLFGGVYIPPDSIPAGWHWFYYLDPIAKGLVAVAEEQFSCGSSVTGICTPFPVTGFGAEPGQLMTREEFTGSFLSFKFSSHALTSNIGWLILTAGIFHILMQLAIHNISHIKR